MDKSVEYLLISIPLGYLSKNDFFPCANAYIDFENI